MKCYARSSIVIGQLKLCEPRILKLDFDYLRKLNNIFKWKDRKRCPLACKSNKYEITNLQVIHFKEQIREKVL